MSYISTLTAFCEFESMENLKIAANKMWLPIYSNICQYLHKIKVKRVEEQDQFSSILRTFKGPVCKNTPVKLFMRIFSHELSRQTTKS